MEKRTQRKEATFKVDLKKPILKDDIKIKATGCLGKLWDITEPTCAKCADREVCHILFKDTINKKAVDLEKEKGIQYLDKTDFLSVSKKYLKSFIISGETTTKELLDEIQKLATTDDRKAVVNWTKNWIKSDPSIKTKSGVCIVS